MFQIKIVDELLNKINNFISLINTIILFISLLLIINIK
jgi:hypothetical protein